MRRLFLLTLVLLAGVMPALAHVGSPDVYADGQAGPYKLFVVIRPPLVIPGVAEIEVRAATPGIDQIQIAPMLLTGDASRHPPVPDTMQKPSGDAQFFTGHLWIMATDSWQIRFTVKGNKGPGVLSIPLPATAMGTRKMQPALGAGLSILGLLLVLGMVGIVGAAVRQAQLTPGEEIPAARRRRAMAAMTITFALLTAAVVLGGKWWNAEAASYAGNVYKPLDMTASLLPGNTLDLAIADPGWLKARKLDDFVPDHNHLMHLYAIRWPAMDVVYHLHPQPVATGDFRLDMPSMAAGTYHLYADVVHANGFPETMVSSITLPAIEGRPLSGDDAMGRIADASSASFRLPDGYTMIWKKPPTLTAQAPEEFRFELLDPHGHPPTDMALYMGMVGHAAFVKSDGTVFAHIHPSGTVAMAALMMAAAQNAPQNSAQSSSMDSMPGMDMSGSIPNTVSFPYGFPTAGRYRVFVQMKHGATVETGAFDAMVEPAHALAASR